MQEENHNTHTLSTQSDTLLNSEPKLASHESQYHTANPVPPGKLNKLTLLQLMFFLSVLGGLVAWIWQHFFT